MFIIIASFFFAPSRYLFCSLIKIILRATVATKAVAVAGLAATSASLLFACTDENDYD